MVKLRREILYLALHNQLLKMVGGVNKIITREDFFIKLGRHYLVPKNVRDLVIGEMEEMELIKQITKTEIKILPCEINIETDANKLYKKAGLFTFI